ncbi:MAG TPA: metallophosphoesterase family protein [Anaerolineae bacterium]|nr:metallophosphoesterase family protein [Anaerolineae bacterium]
MKILIFSDIHANLSALETVLNDAGEMDGYWCLGDLVGYGPDPNQVIERIRALPNIKCVLGNHDAATLNKIEIEAFNEEARKAIQWTQNTITKDNLDFLSDLPAEIVLDHFTLVHGSPRHPTWEYILDTRTATQNFSFFNTSFCFIGHTHIPVIYFLANGEKLSRLSLPNSHTQVTLAPRSILNPGSVGQPRDRDPRASYGILDTNEMLFEFHRILYDIPAVQERMRKAGLPNRHIQRLEYGW